MGQIKEQLKTKSISEKTIPKHVAIIMDGNRRWAKSKNLPQTLGHREGVQALKKIVKHSHKIGVKYLTVYAFSTENWNRKKEEVDFLMKLLSEVIISEAKELIDNGVQISFLGFIEDLPTPLPKQTKELENITRENTGLNLQVALNYGSRAEITHAAKCIAKDLNDKKITLDEVNEELLSSHLLTNKMPDPELLIRTGGELRISNYLLWQCAYSEFYSTDKMWPEFNEIEFDKAINEYSHRQRRFGT